MSSGLFTTGNPKESQLNLNVSRLNPKFTASAEVSAIGFVDDQPCVKLSSGYTICRYYLCIFLFFESINVLFLNVDMFVYVNSRTTSRDSPIPSSIAKRLFAEEINIGLNRVFFNGIFFENVSGILFAVRQLPDTIVWKEVIIDFEK